MGRTSERISVFIRGRLPWGKAPRVDSVDLLHQLPSEDVITTGRLVASIRRSRPDQDLGWNAKNAWDALTEARVAQEHDQDQDYSELIEQAQLQHGYAFARELEAEAKRAQTIRRIKTTLWAVSIVGPVIGGAIEVYKGIKEAVDENNHLAQGIVDAQRRDLNRR